MNRDKFGRFIKKSIPWNKGVPCSEESRRKLSKIQKEKYSRGYINPFSKRTHSKKIRKVISKRTKLAMQNPEIKEKISKTHIGKHRSPKTEFKKGFKHSEEWKKNQSWRFEGENNPFYGRTHSDKIKKKLSDIFSGSKNHFWKGGVSKINKRQRRSLKFRQWRETVFKRDKYACQICGIKSGNGKHIDFHPHHIKPFSQFPKLKFDINNGITLCKNCHLKIHTHKFVGGGKKYGK